MTPSEQSFISALESLLSQIDAAALPEPAGEFGYAIGDKVGDSSLLQACPHLLAGLIALMGPRGMLVGLGAIMACGIDLGRRAQMAVEEGRKLEGNAN